MSDHVLLNSFNELGIIDKLRGLQNVKYNWFINFNSWCYLEILKIGFDEYKIKTVNSGNFIGSQLLAAHQLSCSLPLSFPFSR